MTNNGDDCVSLKEYLLALKVADDRFHEERDRRYTEVNIEKEKALNIKETADLAALGLAREIQTYKDEKANQLREQISSERGLYPTKSELASVSDKLEAQIKPLTDYVSSQQGSSKGSDRSWQTVVTVISIAIALVTLFLKFG